MSFANEKIVETKKCEKTGILFDITNKDLEFYDKISPVFNGKKYSIPTPKLCPEARQQRRLSFRNEKSLYKRKCDFSGEDIISIYSPDKPYKVYSQDIWWSDKWDATDYGRDFDFSKPFFEQFDELLREVPKDPLYQVGENTNSQFTSFIGYMKNCYYLSDSGKSEDCYYGNLIVYSKNCLESSNIYECENCYELINSTKCFKTFYSIFCNNCVDSFYLYNCDSCSFCFGCKNLSNKKYCILNKQYSKEEYFLEIEKLLKKKNIRQIIQDFYKTVISKHSISYNITNSTGDIIYDTKNISDCFECSEIEDSKYCEAVYDVKDSYDISCFGEGMSLCYELSASGGFKGNISIFGCMFSVYCYYGGSNVLYSHSISGESKNLFGCVGLKNKEYCILNKQYTKAEYEELVPKIIAHMQKTGEWGEFFPASISPFGYNETMAQEYFPLTKEEALEE